MDVVNIVKMGKLAELHARKRLSLKNHQQNLATLELKIIDNFVDKFTQEDFEMIELLTKKEGRGWTTNEHYKFLIAKLLFKNLSDTEEKYSKISQYIQTKDVNQVKMHDEAYTIHLFNCTVKTIYLSQNFEPQIQEISWTAKESTLLEDKILLYKDSGFSFFEKCILIAESLKKKTARDVANRIFLMKKSCIEASNIDHCNNSGGNGIIISSSNNKNNNTNNANNTNNMNIMIDHHNSLDFNNVNMIDNLIRNYENINHDLNNSKMDIVNSVNNNVNIDLNINDSNNNSNLEDNNHNIALDDRDNLGNLNNHFESSYDN